MNYVAVTFLVLVVFFLLSNKKVHKYTDIVKNKDKIQEVEKIINETIYINRKDVPTINELEEILKYKTGSFVLYGDVHYLDEFKVELIVANFIKTEKRSSVFGFQYEYNGGQKGIKRLWYKLLIACINYIEMLSKHNNLNFSIVFGSKESIINDLKKNNIVSFSLSPSLIRYVRKNDIKKIIIKRRKLNFRNAFGVLLTILAGSVVTANIVYNLVNVINFNGNLYDIIACILIYICYANITGEIYNSMGIFKFIASYLFPIYIVVFVVSSLYYNVKEMFLKVART